MIGLRWLQALALLLGSLMAVGMGCANHDVETVTVSTRTSETHTVSDSGQSIKTSDELAPATAPDPKAVVRVSGSPFDVELNVVRDRNVLTLILLKDGAEFDREQYQDSYNGFKLSAAAGETYSPAIELLRFPMKVGDSWDWEGEIRLNSDARPATAHIETSSDTQYIDQAPINAVKVRAVLHFQGMAEEQAERTLTFWFAPKRGLFKRQFDTVSIREPRS